ncbi:fibroblast growth factor receptor 4-like, partial [Paramacrobiotus metropolitanus]|uniref:fibroblast growth factor receptor 4-like n=1 Tax=Paramacrobiotus metropolitanus TaxID=2943436 RepID=UPI002445F8DF
SQELTIMAKAGRHLNIINLLGVILKGDLLLLLEYARFGSLLKNLKSHRGQRFYNHTLNGDIQPYDENEAERIQREADQVHPQTADDSDMHILSTRTLLSFAYQISRGMEYLATRSIIHRDLAARNVLICDERVAKISDFGMARQEGHVVAPDPKEALPIRWMAPEATAYKNFSQPSDVWSFGVVLWEIFSLGEVPYSDNNLVRGDTVFEFVETLRNGLRLEQTETCPSVIYCLMCDCWKLSPDDRPTFPRLTQRLRTIVDPEAEVSYLSLDYTYTQFNEEHHDLLERVGEAQTPT